VCVCVYGCVGVYCGSSRCNWAPLHGSHPSDWPPPILRRFPTPEAMAKAQVRGRGLCVTSHVRVLSIAEAAAGRSSTEPPSAQPSCLQASEIKAVIRVLGLAPTKAKNLAALSKVR